MPPSERDQIDLALAQRIRAGHRDAYEELFLEYYENLVRFAASLVSSQDVAEDIVQDALHRFWVYREREGFPPSNVCNYLFSSVRKNASTYLRHRRVVERWEDRAAISASDARAAIGIRPSESADERARFNQLVAAVQVAVDELPVRCREAYLLRRQHGMNYVEIAKVMGISRKTVEVHIGTALRILRARLAEFLYD